MRKLILFASIILISFSMVAAPPKKRTSTRHATTNRTTKSIAKLDIQGDPIDLGLSVMWSSLEIGAKDSLSMGAEFQWGCIVPNDNANLKNYKYYNPVSYAYTKYFNYGDDENDKSSHIIDTSSKSLSFFLDPDDDAAQQLWGNGWRMPTRTELYELKKKCTWKLIEESNKRGYRVTGPNGNSIFISLTDPLERYYWSNCSKYEWNYGKEANDSAYGLLMNSFNVFVADLYRYGGNWIRPVKDYPTPEPIKSTSE